MEPFVWQENGILRLKAWERAYPLVAGMTSRAHPDGGPEPFNLALHVGDDPQRVRARRDALCEALGLPPEAFTCAEQVHGSRVVRVTPQDRGRGRLARETAFPATDGMHTDVPGVLLVAFFADCVPLFFLDPIRRVIGLAHAGWRGTAQDVAGEMVRSLVAHYGTRPRDLRVAIGPSIGPCCYEVDERVAAALRTTFGGEVPDGVLTANDEGRYWLDLRAANQKLCERAGILPENIEMTSVCTACATDRFFSHRAEKGRTGRMAAFVAWTG
ncbi:peptidoglycan editing factor PgeF [Calditerricola satsumensis]|uniref:Purine nucleoside phosphorylase n=2 Tax=Calditerricola satsumensis TaxID=373054 RepID=A0A8J3F9C9_9BACI|nr:peptidoglycan editing factor PgeF [Calditerricola satsumensis]GGJ92219.1 laccase domain protein [Calditerricola satsumensis]